jgi:hypothetical protein
MIGQFVGALLGSLIRQGIDRSHKTQAAALLRTAIRDKQLLSVRDARWLIARACREGAISAEVRDVLLEEGAFQVEGWYDNPKILRNLRQFGQAKPR